MKPKMKRVKVKRVDQFIVCCMCGWSYTGLENEVIDQQTEHKKSCSNLPVVMKL